MSKELEEFEIIIEKTDSLNNTCVHLPKCLKDNKCRYNIDNLMCHDYEMANNIKQELLKAQEMKKAIDVIKKKHYDDYMLTFETYEAYQENANRVYEEELVIDWSNEEQLLELNLYTQQEFDLLQKWLKKDKSE